MECSVASRDAPIPVMNNASIYKTRKILKLWYLSKIYLSYSSNLNRIFFVVLNQDYTGAGSDPSKECFWSEILKEIWYDWNRKEFLNIYRRMISDI